MKRFLFGLFLFATTRNCASAAPPRKSHGIIAAAHEGRSGEELRRTELGFPSERAVQKARDRLLSRGYDPGTPAKTETPGLRRAVRLFQRELSLDVTGHLDRGTLAALGVAPDGSDIRVAGSVPPWGKRERHALHEALQLLDESRTKLGEQNRDEEEKRLDVAKSLLEKGNYHAGRERVLEANLELDLARDAYRGNRESEADRALKKASRKIREALDEREDLSGRSRAAEPEARSRDARSSAREAKSGCDATCEPKNEKEKPCAACDATSGSGSWMKDATE